MRLMSSLSQRLLLSTAAFLYCHSSFAVDSTPDAENEETVDLSATFSVQASSKSSSAEGNVRIPAENAPAPEKTKPKEAEQKKFGRGVVRGTTYSSSPQRYAFELRLGPYFPDIDKGSSRTSQRDFFGSKDRLYIGAELDWQFARIPYLGTVGIGASIGYVNFSGTNKLADGTDNTGDQLISQESSLTIAPMSLVAVVRLDEAARRWPIPLVPYAKMGVGFAFWSVHDGVGIARTDGGEPGRGNATGLQAALGGMFLLDFLEPSAARFLDVESGINNSYLFMEWTHSSLGGPNSMNVGSASTWVTGIALEM